MAQVRQGRHKKIVYSAIIKNQRIISIAIVRLVMTFTTIRQTCYIVIHRAQPDITCFYLTRVADKCKEGRPSSVRTNYLMVITMRCKLVLRTNITKCT